jgi:hypothetical protein
MLVFLYYWLHPWLTYNSNNLISPSVFGSFRPGIMYNHPNSSKIQVESTWIKLARNELAIGMGFFPLLFFNASCCIIEKLQLSEIEKFQF